MKHNQLVLTRSLPKTGQTTLYQSTDDGHLEIGWWRSRLNINNKTRFVTKVIGGDIFTIDRATGLIWAANGNAAGCNNGSIVSWNEALVYALSLSFAGYSDWRLPNINELRSIICFSVINPAIYTAFFSNTKSANYWSSTTRSDYTIMAWVVDFSSGVSSRTSKSDSIYLRCVRSGR